MALAGAMAGGGTRRLPSGKPGPTRVAPGDAARRAKAPPAVKKPLAFSASKAISSRSMTDPKWIDALRAAAQAAANPADALRIKAQELTELLGKLKRLEEENRSLRAAATFGSDAA